MINNKDFISTFKYLILFVFEKKRIYYDYQKTK